MLSLLISAFFEHLADWWKPASPAPSDWLSEGALLGFLIVLTLTAACAVTGLLNPQALANDGIQT